MNIDNNINDNNNDNNNNAKLRGAALASLAQS